MTVEGSFVVDEHYHLCALALVVVVCGFLGYRDSRSGNIMRVYPSSDTARTTRYSIRFRTTSHTECPDIGESFHVVYGFHSYLEVVVKAGVWSANQYSAPYPPVLCMVLCVVKPFQ